MKSPENPIFPRLSRKQPRSWTEGSEAIHPQCDNTVCSQSITCSQAARYEIKITEQEGTAPAKHVRVCSCTAPCLTSLTAGSQLKLHPHNTQQQPRAWSCPLALPARWGSGHLLSPPRLQRAGSTAGVLRHEGQMSPDRRKVWWKQSSHPWGLLAASSLISLVFSVTNHENWCWPLARLKGKPSRRYTWGHNPENTIFRNEITPTKLTKKHCKGIRDKEGL